MAALASTTLLGAFLLLGASLLAGYVGHLIFKRYRISDVLFLIFVGVAAGPVLGLVDAARLGPLFLSIAPLGLVIVLFEGGLELAWDDVRRHAWRAVGMSLVTWALTALAVALVAYYVLGFGAAPAALLGLATCATGIFVVVPLLARVNAPADARVLLTLETSLGDLLSAVATTALAGILVLGSAPSHGVLVLSFKFLVGGAVGLLAGVVWARVLTPLNGSPRHTYPLTLAWLLIAYVAAETLGGSGYLCALAFGLVIGNAGALMRLGGLARLSTMEPAARAHQSEIIFVLRSVYFVFLGALVSREAFAPHHMMGGVALVGAMILARVVGVRAGLAGSAMGRDASTRLLVVSMMPRGLATALIAALPAAMGVPGTEAFLDYTFLMIVGMDLATTLGLAMYSRERRKPAAAAAAPAMGAG